MGVVIKIDRCGMGQISVRYRAVPLVLKLFQKVGAYGYLQESACIVQHRS